MTRSGCCEMWSPTQVLRGIGERSWLVPWFWLGMTLRRAES